MEKNYNFLFHDCQSSIKPTVPPDKGGVSADPAADLPQISAVRPAEIPFIRPVEDDDPDDSKDLHRGVPPRFYP
ncbi:MAG: hypothetical protein PHU79_01935 [Oscillospiraceae bacterium]|nr:hypothetical protein [Oscillospiraceae bacterium]